MRIITGIYKGRNIKGDNILGTRPTMNRVKESTIAMLQNNIENAVVLDLFAGSGSFGIELLSNHAKTCYFIDNNLKCIKTIDDNLKMLNITNARVIYKDYLKALDYFDKSDIRFDIIYLDPPYETHLISGAMKRILKNNLLKESGLIVCEYTSEHIDTELQCIKQRKFGDKSIDIYKR